MRRPWWGAVEWVGFVAVVAAVAVRTYLQCNVVGQPTLPLYGMQDFRDAIYYPAVAFLAGVNPYDPSPYLRQYPAAFMLGPYAPAVLLLYAPLATLTLGQAEVVFFLLNVGLVVALAATILLLCDMETTVDRSLGLAALLVLSHAGHSTLFLGQSTFYVLIGAFLALYWSRTRPWAAGAAFALTVLKPTYGVPLGLVMVCLGEWRPVIIGGLLCGLASMLVLLRLAVAADLPTVVHGVLGSADLLDISVNKSSTSLRIDLPGLVERLTGVHASGAGGALVTLVVLTLGIATVRRAARVAPGSERHLVWALICLTVLTCTYHQGYDALMLALPATALAAGGWRPQLPLLGSTTWLVLLACLVFPGFNYVATYHVAARFRIEGAGWIALASTNGVLIDIAFLICAGVAYASRRVTP